MALNTLAGLGIGNAGFQSQLPAVLKELQQFTISGPITGGAANAALTVVEPISPYDTILKVLMFANGVPSDITSTVTAQSHRATGTITVNGAVAGDSITVGGAKLTLSATQTSPSQSLPPGQVSVGGTDSVTAANLTQAINSQNLPVKASVNGTTITINSNVDGTAGNAVTLVSSGAHFTVSGATLTGGTAQNSIKSTANTTGNYLLVFWYKKN